MSTLQALQKIKDIYTWLQKNWRIWAWRIADIGWVLALILIIVGWFNISNQLTDIKQKINENEAQGSLMTYFSNIEEWDLTWAYNILSDDFRDEQTYDGFYNWLHNTVWFEWLKFTELTGKNTAIQKVYLVEFWFKVRWKIPLDTKRWMYMRYNDWKREINANSILYENWRKPTACKFYHFDHCK